MENNKPSRATKKSIEVLNFDLVKVPSPKGFAPKDDNIFASWGVDNLYPYFLLDLRNTSPTHAALLASKGDYIIGDGPAIAGKKLEVKVNEDDTAAELIRKCVDEYLTYNCFAVEVVYDRLMQAIEFHSVPMHKLRMNKSKTKFWFSNDWAKEKFSAVMDRWMPVPSDMRTKIYFYEGYAPSYGEYYPTVDYVGGLKSIMIEAKVQSFNMNTLDSHFSPSTIVTFHGGSNVSAEQKAGTIKALKDSYTGVTGKKIIVDFQTPEGKPASVQNISSGDWADVYESTLNNARDTIFIAHQITSPSLFGVKTAGQLGGGQELKEAFEIFKNKFVVNKRNELLAAFNMMFAGSRIIQGKVEFMDRPLFSATVSDATREKIMTINEMRKEAGLPPIPDGDRLIGSTPAPAVTPQPQAPNQPTGAPAQPAPNPNAPTKMFKGESVELGDADFEKIADMGSILDDFEVIGEGEYVFSASDARAVELRFDTQADIADYIISNGAQETTIGDLKKAIRKDLGISVTTGELTSTLDSLATAGVIEVSTTESGVTIKPSTKKDEPNVVEVMYSYTTRPGHGEDIIPTSRPFCRRLIQNGRLYTRAEIQQMSQIFGYDIYLHGGGFYRDPETGDIKTHCRHQWRAFTVARRRR